MAVAEISGPKIVIRVPDIDQLGSDAKSLFVERMRDHTQDGSIWIIPFFGHDQWKLDTESLIELGFDFFIAECLPYDERPWAKRVCVKYLRSGMPSAQILWINPNNPIQAFEGRPFEICTYQEFHEIISVK
jgi:hypothetical protein